MTNSCFIEASNTSKGNKDTSSGKKPKKRIIKPSNQRQARPGIPAVPSKKSKIEILNTYSKSIAGKGRPNRTKSPMIAMRAHNLATESKKMKDNVSEGDGEDTLRISIRDKLPLKPQGTSYDDDELDIEIIDKSEIEKDRYKDNMIVVDLMEAASPKKANEEQKMPLVNISLETKQPKKRRGRESRDHPQQNADKSELKSFSKKDLRIPLTDKPQSTFDTQDLNNLEKHSDIVEFTRTKEPVKKMNITYENTTPSITQNFVSQSYKAPDAPTKTKEVKNLARYNESSGNVILESTVEEKLKQTNELINEAINALELTQSSRMLNDTDDRVEVLKSERDRFQKISDYVNTNPNAQVQRKPKPVAKIDIYKEQSFEPIEDVTPVHFVKKMTQPKYTSPHREEYEAMNQDSPTANEVLQEDSSPEVASKPKTKSSKAAKRRKQSSPKNKRQNFRQETKASSLKKQDNLG